MLRLIAFYWSDFCRAFPRLTLESSIMLFCAVGMIVLWVAISFMFASMFVRGA